ncbi:hypothetical protein ACF0H5_009781 [Mactra antiquata]
MVSSRTNMVLNISRLICLIVVSTRLVYGSDVADDKRAVTQLTVDAYCQRTYSNASYLCRDNYNTGYDYICGSLFCFDALYLKQCVFSIPPQDSTLCGNAKWCEAQSCQPNANALATSDACPLGDTTKQDVILNMNCAEIVAKRPSLCLDDKVKKIWCCDSCAKVNTVDPASFTGPQKSAATDCQEIFGSGSYFCQGTQYYNSGHYSSVCSTMYCFNPSTGNCDPFPASNGVPCGSGNWCVNGKCTASPAASVNPLGDCLYGNQYEQFCRTNVVYPNIAQYCSQYEAGCCDICSQYKNTSRPSGCEYGDAKPDVCSNHVKDGTIKSYCGSNENDCCETCPKYKDAASACPYGDINSARCQTLMNDSIGVGNCYNSATRQECCETCAGFYNASRTGCEYGDHWKDYCHDNVVPPKVADQCGRYADKCCGTCTEYENQGFPGCKYGDQDPTGCEALMKYSDLKTANCYNIAHRTQCCGTCNKLKDSSTPGCLYGDTKPNECEKLFNGSRGIGNCYDFTAQYQCCRSCQEAKNVTDVGCEWGDSQPDYCQANIFDKSNSFICFTNEQRCCETCKQYKVSDNPDCKYGDKNPINCKFQIPDADTARVMCPTLGTDCCETCSRLGHPGPGGSISGHILG